MKLARSLVVLIAAALVAAPIVLDACSISCDAPAAGVIVAAAAGCHHAPASGLARIRTAPTRCGHDHSDQHGVIGTRDHSRHQPRQGPAGQGSSIDESPIVGLRAGMFPASLTVPGARHAHASLPIVTPLRI